MAKTGIKITMTDTVLGAPIDVNTTSMIMLVGSGAPNLTQLLRGSVESIESDWWEQDGHDILKYLANIYYTVNNGANSGKLLWLSSATHPDEIESRLRFVLTIGGFDKRPRQVAIVGYDFQNMEVSGVSPDLLNPVVDALQAEGIRCVFITQLPLDYTSVEDSSPSTTYDPAPFVSWCCCASSDPKYPQIDGATYAVAQLAQISVGTSIGDGGLAPMSEPSQLCFADNYRDITLLKRTEIEALGEKGFLFTRTRPPRNGLWWNDGATCNDPANALSTLEAARTICAMADDLQSFFVPYINTRVPVTSTGDIQSAYKQVVLDNARAAVVQKYIENGDISDARINLVAKNNDMIGTRTWEVTLSILPAPTLRWIDGYVFYVKSL